MVRRQRRFGGQGDRQRTERMIDRAHGVALGDLSSTLVACIDLGHRRCGLLEQHAIDVEVPAEHVDEWLPTIDNACRHRLITTHEF